MTKKTKRLKRKIKNLERWRQDKLQKDIFIIAGQTCLECSTWYWCDSWKKSKNGHCNNWSPGGTNNDKNN